jgi:hypothetical protein
MIPKPLRRRLAKLEARCKPDEPITVILHMYREDEEVPENTISPDGRSARIHARAGETPSEALDRAGIRDAIIGLLLPPTRRRPTLSPGGTRTYFHSPRTARNNIQIGPRIERARHEPMLTFRTPNNCR